MALLAVGWGTGLVVRYGVDTGVDEGVDVGAVVGLEVGSGGDCFFCLRVGAGALVVGFVLLSSLSFEGKVGVIMAEESGLGSGFGLVALLGTFGAFLVGSFLVTLEDEGLS
jgi:hypothetical protein